MQLWFVPECKLTCRILAPTITDKTRSPSMIRLEIPTPAVGPPTSANDPERCGGSRTGLASEQQVLQLFLEAEDSEKAQQRLDELLTEHVAPIVEQIVRFKIHSFPAAGRGHEAQDEEDIRSDVFLTLISRLRDMRAEGSSGSIDHFRGYVATTTYNAFHRYIREK